MSNDTWMGLSIERMSRDQLAEALRKAVRLLQSVPRAQLTRRDVEVRQTPTGTAVSRTFKWAFIPAGYIWSDGDRRDTQVRLDEFAAQHGLHGALVRFGSDRLDVEVPINLEPEQVLALQDWLDAEGDALDVSQVP
jgi:hypothetical protein